MGVTTQQVVSLLENVLFESATQAAGNAARWQGNAAATDVGSLAAAMSQSGEAKIAATVVGYYLSSLGRAPSAAEIRFYVAAAEQGLSPGQIAAGQVSSATWDQISQYFAHSPEFAARGGLDSNIGLDATGLALQAVPWLYQSVLGRAPNSQEIAYYDNQILNGADIGTLFRAFTASPEFHSDTDNRIASALADYGTAMTEGHQTPPTVGTDVTVGPPPPPTPTPTPVPAPAPAPSYSLLTTGADTIDDHLTAPHTYTATLGSGATLTTGDNLTGNGFATLAITDSASNAQDILSGVTLSGVSTITLDTQGNAGVSASQPIYLSGQNDVATLSVTSHGTQGDFLVAGSSTDVTVTSVSSQVYVRSFGDLTIHDSNLTTLTALNGSGNLTIGTVTATHLQIYTSSLGLSGILMLPSGALTSVDITNNSVGAGDISGVIGGAGQDMTMTGNFHFGGNDMSSALNVAGIHSLDLSAVTSNDTSYLLFYDNPTVTVGGNNYEMYFVGGGTLTVGAGTNFDANNPIPNVVVTTTGPLSIHFATTPSGLVLDPYGAFTETTAAAVIADLLFFIQGQPGSVEYGTDGTTTYIAESDDGTTNPGHVTLIAVHGNYATITASGTQISVP